MRPFIFKIGHMENWDNFVSSSPHGHYMQSHAWGELLRQSGWEPHYLTWRQKKIIHAAALLLERKVPGLGWSVYYSPRGPVLDYSDKAAVYTVTAGLKDFLAQKRGVFLRNDPYIEATSNYLEQDLLPSAVEVQRDWSYWNAPKLVLWLDLRGDENEVFMRTTAGCRNEVRQGYRNGVEFSLGTATDLNDFYHLMSVTGQHKGIAFHDLAYYQKLYDTLNVSANVQMFLGRYEGEVITTGISLIYGEKAWLLYAASTPSSYKLRANRTLQWEMIKWAHAQGCVRYDFRGTATNDPPSSDDPGYGVYKFKKSFGAEYTRLIGYYDLVNSPGIYRMFRFGEEKILPAAYRFRTWLGERGRK